MPVLITRDSLFVNAIPSSAMLCDITYIDIHHKVINMYFYLNNSHISIVCKQDMLLSEMY